MTHKQEESPSVKIKEAKIVGKYSVIVAVIGAIAAVLAVVIPPLGNSGPDSISTTPPSTVPALVIPLSTDSNSNPLLSVAIREKETGYLFDGELFITVESVDPRVRQVTGAIGSRGHPNQRFEGAELGDVIVYEGDRRYEIRIARFEAGFGVSSSTIEFYAIPVEK